MNVLRPTAADIDGAAFLHNLALAGRLAGGAAVMAVLKANAYGHGVVPLARLAADFGCPIIGVATVAEGMQLRQAGLEAEILVLSGFPPGSETEAAAAGLSAVVHDADGARRLDEAARHMRVTIPVHVKFDTGMGRLGFLPAEAESVLAAVRGWSHLDAVGIMTHYGRAEETDETPTLAQAALFDSILAKAGPLGLRFKWVHAMNSAALLLGRGPTYNLVRPGIMLYGSTPGDLDAVAHDLKPVMTLRTAIIQLRRVPDGWPISYGALWRARGERMVAVLPIGYADGFLRYNTGGEALVRGRRVRVIGTICMDMAMLDVTEVGGVSLGDEAVLIGRQGGECIGAADVARRGGTIAYEVYCALSGRVPRIFRMS